MSPPSSSTGLIVIRAWLEDATPPLRVEVRFSADVDQKFSPTVSFADVEAVCVEVRRCLEWFLIAGESAVQKR
jgi:hypothetical protein